MNPGVPGAVLAVYLQPPPLPLTPDDQSIRDGDFFLITEYLPRRSDKARLRGGHAAVHVMGLLSPGGRPQPWKKHLVPWFDLAVAPRAKECAGAMPFLSTAANTPPKSAQPFIANALKMLISAWVQRRTAEPDWAVIFCDGPPVNRLGQGRAGLSSLLVESQAEFHCRVGLKMPCLAALRAWRKRLSFVRHRGRRCLSPVQDGYAVQFS